MPRRPPPERRAKILTLRDFTPNELLSFAIGWTPNSLRATPPNVDPDTFHGPQRWDSWAAFVDDWRAIETEWMRNPPLPIEAGRTFVAWLTSAYTDAQLARQLPAKPHPTKAILPVHPVLERYRSERMNVTGARP